MTPTNPWNAEELRALNQRFRLARPEDLLGWAAEALPGQVALTVSFGGAAGMVLLDLVARNSLAIDVLFLDTDLLFRETYALAEVAAQRYGVQIRRQRPDLDLYRQAMRHGPDLFARDSDRCCSIRKVAPLAEALAPYGAWVSGIRRDQTSNRATTEPLQWSLKYGLLKISPLAAWSEADVWRYIHAHDVPYNPLLDQGYPSLGCAPCTRPASAEDPRGGRWSGHAKTECGLHLEPATASAAD